MFIPQNRVMWQSQSPSRGAQRYEAFLAQHPGLKATLSTIDHPIVLDLEAKCRSFGSISPAQIALAFKLHADAMTPKRPTEAHVPAPTGRHVIRGTVVSIKEHRGEFGDSLKMTVKVTTDTGTWLCWGTVPSSLTARTWSPYQSDHAGALTSEITKGSEVEFTATLVAGREPHFAFFKRPTNASIVAAEPTPEVEPRPGMAGGVVARLNSEMGIRTRE